MCLHIYEDPSPLSVFKLYEKNDVYTFFETVVVVGVRVSFNHPYNPIPISALQGKFLLSEEFIDSK